MCPLGEASREEWTKLQAACDERRITSGSRQSEFPIAILARHFGIWLMTLVCHAHVLLNLHVAKMVVATLEERK